MIGRAPGLVVLFMMRSQQSSVSDTTVAAMTLEASIVEPPRQQDDVNAFFPANLDTLIDRRVVRIRFDTGPVRKWSCRRFSGCRRPCHRGRFV